jgi:hypothetical protein
VKASCEGEEQKATSQSHGMDGEAVRHWPKTGWQEDLGVGPQAWACTPGADDPLRSLHDSP